MIIFLFHISILIILNGLIAVLNKLNVKHVIIGKQYEESENLKEFIEIVNAKKIDVKILQNETEFQIDRYIKIKVLWPIYTDKISDNSINNNALVIKIFYKNFSALFTGDIEELTENALIEKYKNTNILESTILKVSHHGSKTSSKEEFLKLVKPKVALIGVGENNTFGHPNNDVIERLKNINCKIYRTDEDGEITINVDNNANIKINNVLK